MIKRALDSFKKNDPNFQVNPNSLVLTNYKTQYSEDLAAELHSRESLNILNEGNAEIGMVISLNVEKIYFSKSQHN